MAEAAPSAISDAEQALNVASYSSNREMPVFAHLYASPLAQDTFNAQGSRELKPVDELQYGEERSALLEVLRLAGRAVKFKSEVATAEKLIQSITESKVLHFTGHGKKGALTLEDIEQHGRMSLLEEAPLKRWFKVKDSIPELVFVSACHSESVAAAIVEAGVPHVVVVNSDHMMLDETAVKFTRIFYRHLLHKHSVSESFSNARNALELSPDSDEVNKFKLLPEEGDHSQKLFEHTPEGPFVDATVPPAPRGSCPTVADYFAGRELDVYAVLDATKKSSAVCVTGCSGIGKTQVAVKACHYACERHFVEAVLFCSLDTEATSSEDSPEGLPGGATRARTGSLHGSNGNIAALVDTARARAIAKAVFAQPADVSAAMGGTPQQIAENLINGIELRCSGAKKTLLVLDGCLPWLIKGRVSTRKFVDDLIQKTKNVIVLMTSVESIGVRGEKVHKLDALERVCAARLFVQASPREYKSCDLLDGSVSEKTHVCMEPLHVFSNGTIMGRLQYRPGNIMLFISKLGDRRSLLHNVTEIKETIIPAVLQHQRERDAAYKTEADEVELAASRARQQGPGLAAAAPADNPQNKFVHSRSEQVEGEEVWLTVKRRAHACRAAALGGASPLAVLPPSGSSPALSLSQHNSRNLSSGSSHTFGSNSSSSSANGSGSSEKVRPTWQELCEFGLCDYFKLKLGDQRLLSNDDYKFLGKCPDLWLPQTAPLRSGGSNVVDEVAYTTKFWPWFYGMVRTLKVTGLWSHQSPEFILGLDVSLPKEALNSAAHRSSCGTFLFRVSVSNANAVVLCFRRRPGEETRVVQVKYSDATGRFEVEKDQKSYTDLSNLIADQACLQRLYPDMPKAEALERLRSATTAATTTAAV